MINCSICNEDFEGHGHNADPINDGRCCEFCNFSMVIPARLDLLDNSELY